ncbi:MAG: hypothetical protein ACREPU_02940 [Rhodanobacteraceae bacterium]
MNFVEMTNEEWEEVRKHHDAMVQMGKLELQAEEIHEYRPNGGPQQSGKPVERQLRELEEVVVSLSH